MLYKLLLYGGVPAVLGAVLGGIGRSYGVKDVGPVSVGLTAGTLGSLLYLISELVKGDSENKRSENIRVYMSESGIPIIIKEKEEKLKLKSELPPEQVLNRMIINI